MAVIETLVGETKGVFGKAYVLGGLLPAGLLLLSLFWYFWGFGGIKERLLTPPPAAEAGDKEKGNRAAELETNTSALLLGAGTVLTLTALVFFAARGPVLLFFQELPGGLLRPISKSLRERKLVALGNNLQEERRLLWTHSALLWPSKKFEAYPYVEAWVKPKDLSDAIDLSQKARVVLGRCTVDFEDTGLGREDRKQIEEGLLALRETTALAKDPKWNSEVEAWRLALENNNPAVRLLTDIADDLHREWVDVKRKINDFPQKLWVSPTILGNRFRAIEEYSVSRYNVDMHTLWLRLVGVLSDEQRKEVEDAELSVEAMLNLAAASAVFFVVVLGSAGYNALRVASAPAWSIDRWCVAMLATSAVLTWIFYRGAIFAVGSLRDKVTRLFDLNQARLIDALGFETPKTLGEQRSLLVEISAFFMQAGKLRENWPMKPPNKSTDKESSKAEEH